jgi:hypothetical protein
MDGDLKCNRLVCRKALTDKAVVVSCSLHHGHQGQRPDSNTIRLYHADHLCVYKLLRVFYQPHLNSLRQVLTSSAVHGICSNRNGLDLINLSSSVDCANELFNTSQLCPGLFGLSYLFGYTHAHESKACETTLSEPCVNDLFI